MRKLFPILAAAALVTAGPALAQQTPISDAAFFAQISRVQAFTQDLILARLKPAPLLSKRAVENKVIARLAGTGVSAAAVRAAIEDPAVSAIPEIIKIMSGGASGPPLTYEQYRALFITPDTVRRGAQFYRDHEALLAQIQARYGVDPLIPVSLVGLETLWGSYTGTYPVISALFTMAAAFPSLSNWASGQIAQYLEICRLNSISPEAISGSYAGAFGYYQFMPSSYNTYAVDFDGDGRKSWDQWPDVLASVANYLTRNGYKPGPDESAGSPVWKALYSYNHSDYYVRAILDMRRSIQAQLNAPDAP